MRNRIPFPGRSHANQSFRRALPARTRVSGRAAASERSAALLVGVGLGERLVCVRSHGHVRLREELLQVLVLVQEGADISVRSVWHLLPIEHNEGEAAAMILN